MIVSFVLYTKDGTRHAGPKTAWATSSIDVGVAVLDILFSFAGHVVFFELMQSMISPEEYDSARFFKHATHLLSFGDNVLQVGNYRTEESID